MPPPLLRVMTYNIHYGTSFLGRRQLEAQAATIRAVGADVVIVQEVLGLEQAEYLKVHANFEHLAFAEARRNFGNAMLSRWPLSDVENHAVPRGFLTEPRVVLTAHVEALGLRVIAAHFGFLPGEPELSAQVVLAIAARADEPLVVGGDFNRPRAAAVCHRLLRGALTDAATANGRLAQRTFPSPRPVMRLDYLYVRHVDIHSVQVLPSQASDHRPLVAELAPTK